jgi:hypothetical protein
LSRTRKLTHHRNVHPICMSIMNHNKSSPCS